MTGELILITGVTGFVGFQTLVHTLKSGYRARAVVRKESQIKELKRILLEQGLERNVEFVVIPDLCEKNAFAGRLDGVDYIFHVASPMNTTVTDNYARDYFRPAIDMTTGILTNAAGAKSVKRVVITSSITALMNVFQYATRTLKKTPFSSDDEICTYDIKTPFPHPLLAYAASKMAVNKPGFDVVYLMPSLVIGPNLLSKTPEELLSGTNDILLKVLLGGKAPQPSIDSSVSIQDVAKLHIQALDPSVPAGRYLAASPGHWMEALQILKDKYPREIGKTFSIEGNLDVFPILFDTTKTEKVFDFKFQTFEERASSVIDYYLELAARLQ